MEVIPKLQACLDDERPDLAVSEWLTYFWNHSPQTVSSNTFMSAYLTDQFLQIVNMDGLASFFELGENEVQHTISGLTAMGLDDIVAAIEKSKSLDESSAEFEANQQKLMLASGEIEQATHRYIRANLAEFEAFENCQ
ncbi:MAG: hypothetical protein K1X67_05355 [Fimbriimonadaceae bacterium]|nr:hypothetical protein [Fimbriimonadaceae bacterium]